MPYVDVYGWKQDTLEGTLGYDRIPLIRPAFSYFKFTGLRPNTPHWLFFDGKDVTKWVNTSYTLEDYNDEARNSNIRNPGDQYTNATAFPSQFGGPTAPTGSVSTNQYGELEGLFYIQSNELLSFSTGIRVLTAIDISVLKENDCLSYATAEYAAIGEYELRYEYLGDEYWAVVDQKWEDPPAPPPSNNGGNDNDNSPTPVYSYTYTNDQGQTVYSNTYGDENDAIMASYEDAEKNGGTATGWFW